MNSEYIRLAYERTVIADCRRHLMEKRLEGGGTTPDPLICEALPYELREVPNEVFVDVIQRLEAEEKRLTDEMAQYEFRKRDERPPLARKPDAPEPQPQPVAGAQPPRKGFRRRAEPQDAGGGGQ